MGKRAVVTFSSREVYIYGEIDGTKPRMNVKDMDKVLNFKLTPKWEID